MAKPSYDWYLSEWLAHRRKKQSDVVKELGWNKARVSLMVSGKQQYTRDALNEMATYLDVQPHELLMHPDEANRLRRLRQDIAILATSVSKPDDQAVVKKVSSA